MIIIDGETIKPPAPLVSTSYIDGSEVRFRARPRNKNVRFLVIHETAGNTKQGVIDNFARPRRTKAGTRYYAGVQLILDRNGYMSCHGDLIRDRMVHANQLNNESVGIEIVNPYAPSLAKLDSGDVPQVIDANWWTWCPDKNDRRYLCPSPAQLSALRMWVPWLCGKLEIPYEFPTWYLDSTQRKIKGWSIGAKPDAGVVAHRDFGKHADGRWPLEYLIADKLRRG